MSAVPAPKPSGGGPRGPIEPPQGPRPAVLPKVLDREEVERLAAAAATGRCAARNRALVLVLWGTGGRVSEVCAAQLGAYRENGGPHLSVGGKTGERLLELPAASHEALVAYLRERGVWYWREQRSHEPLFASMQGGPIGRKAVWRLLKQAALAAGLDPARVHPHVLRHTCATHLLEGGASVRDVQAYLGHARVATTQLYTHVARGRLADVARSCHPAARSSP